LNSRNPKLNVILFVATCATTFATGWLQQGRWQSGAWYSAAIISILLAHEMGHYIMCRKYGIRATLPFFIPFLPVINPFGTMGAVIRMESAIPSRKALFDVAVAGPLAGLAVTIPCIYYGIQFSEIIDLTQASRPGAIHLGESYLYQQISKIAIGNLPQNKDVLLHPLAFAGWAGLFVTALNLLPIGQLDGGHIVYAMIGRRHKLVAMAALLAFAVVCVFMYRGWALLLLLILWFGYRHPPTLDETPVDGARMLLGIVTMIFFVLSFTPEPFKF
jgi:membrane-associated protease RseP (regulator of RpoE activity)